MDCLRNRQEGANNMKKSIFILIGGVLAGIALCLTAARYLPIDEIEDLDMF